MGGFEALKNNMNLILGTALWGWTIPENTCFEILDEFYQSGFRGIDTATNYPINKDKRYFRFAETVLKKWIDANGVNDLKVTIKTGSIDNNGSTENNLTYSSLIMSHDYYREKFEDNLDTFMVHWDNRDDEESISQTISSLNVIRRKCRVGLSGIKNPGIYFKYLKKTDTVSSIQIKHNIFESHYARYSHFHDLVSFVAYGINAGGLKFDNEYHALSSISVRSVNTSSYHACLTDLQSLISDSKICRSFNDVSMVYAINSPGISGIISGASSRKQMKETIESFNNLLQLDTSKLYRRLVEIRI